MSKAIMYIYVSILVSANLVFGLFLPMHREPQDLSASASEWNLPAFNRALNPDTKELLATGFWGKVDFSIDETAEHATPNELAADEAKKLRAQVKAIINNDRRKEIVFAVEKVYHRINLGDLLPETQWTLIDVGEDWLKLSKDGVSNNIEILKLFVGADVGNLIDAEK